MNAQKQLLEEIIEDLTQVQELGHEQSPLWDAACDLLTKYQHKLKELEDK